MSYRIATVFLLLSATTCLQASTIDAIYSFGDSLSDAGNLYTATSALGSPSPGAPYVNGEFSNGPVWAQDLSKALGLGTLSASLQGGNDFAYGGGFSGNSPIHTGTTVGPAATDQLDLTGPAGQLAQFQALHPIADPNALYTIWIGSNDMLALLQSGATPAAAAADIAAVVANVDSAVGSLASEGAKNFLIATVPDLGKAPEVAAQGAAAQAAASALSAAFDTALLGSLAGQSGLDIQFLNTYSLIDGIVANGSAYGFTNVTSPCVTGANALYQGGVACSSNVAVQDSYLFWDGLHPTAPAQALIADAALSLVTPEPATCALIGIGLIGFYIKRRRPE